MSSKLNANEIIRLLDVLIGDVTPYGDQAIDNEKIWNTKTMIDVIDWALPNLIEAAKERFSPYESARKIAEEAYQSIKQWKDYFDEVVG